MLKYNTQLQIFNQLEFLGNDHHPDAHACRLKLSAVTVGLGEGASSMKCPWSIAFELCEYVRKHSFVSSACRLSSEEELLLLKLCGKKIPLALMNRRAFVAAVNALGSLSRDQSATVKLGVRKAPQYANFDCEKLDNTILIDPKNSMVGSKIFGAAYSRIDQVSWTCRCHVSMLRPC